jgi:cysteine desulfurase
MLYLDNSATTRPFPEVVNIIAKIMEKHYGNPSSLHRLGVESEMVLTQAREVAAKLLNIQKEEIIFTSGGTESNNIAIKGAAYQYQARGRHLITSQVEHASVYEAFRQLEKIGFHVTYLPVDKTGRVRLTDLESAITDETTLVSIMHVNNETGTIQPIREVGELLRNYPKILFHVDAVQAYGKVPIDIKGWGIDLLSLSGHKFHGPKGTGLLFKREGLLLEPLFAGGGQEAGVRPGTENLPNIVGLAKAMRMVDDRKENDISHLFRLKHRLYADLSKIEYLDIHSPTEYSAPHIMNVSVPGLKAEVIVHSLEEKGYLVSTRSACSSKQIEPSRVLMAMGLPKELATGSIRISLEPSITLDQIKRFGIALQETLDELSVLRV